MDDHWWTWGQSKDAPIECEERGWPGRLVPTQSAGADRASWTCVEWSEGLDQRIGSLIPEGSVGETFGCLPGDLGGGVFVEECCERRFAFASFEGFILWCKTWRPRLSGGLESDSAM
jgi:hypothetical protein